MVRFPSINSDTNRLRRKLDSKMSDIDLVVTHAPLYTYFIYVIGIILFVALLGALAGCTQASRDQYSGNLGGEVSISKRGSSIEEITETSIPE